MKLHTHKFEQFLPISLDEAWDFFSKPDNLNEITPEDMKFEILTKDISNMYQGQVIQYNVTPFPLIKMGWVTEITHVKNEAYFVDEQRFGPYAMWHHEHHFRSNGEETIMEDIIHFKMPLGFLGRIAYALFAKKQLHKIFTFRKEEVAKVFT